VKRIDPVIIAPGAAHDLVYGLIQDLGLLLQTKNPYRFGIRNSIFCLLHVEVAVLNETDPRGSEETTLIFILSLAIFIIALVIAGNSEKSEDHPVSVALIIIAICVFIFGGFLVPVDATYEPVKDFKFVKDDRTVVILAHGIYEGYTDAATYVSIDKLPEIYIKRSYNSWGQRITSAQISLTKK
jgi:hypothetical protein